MVDLSKAQRAQDCIVPTGRKQKRPRSVNGVKLRSGTGPNEVHHCPRN